jgi:SAM-dependent methyltransferase
VIIRKPDIVASVRWLAKAMLQDVLSHTPGGERLNYVLQRRVLHTLPLSAVGFRRKAERAFEHFAAFREFVGVEPAAASFYEFGAGWDLTIPLMYYALGVEHQTLVDVRPLARLELVEHTIQMFEQVEIAADQPLRPLGEPHIGSVEELRERFGIDYLAPSDAGDSGLPSDSFDFISSTDTLEHIPERDLRRVLAECRRLLMPGGVLSSRVDLEDHYSHFDRSLSDFNFLKFGERSWRLFNPSLHYQSRLRYTDYVRLLHECGFEIIRQRTSRVSDAELERLRGLELAPRFRGYSLDELAVKGLVFVATTPNETARRSAPA